MRGIVSYLIGGILVVLAMDFVASPVGFGLAVGAWPIAARGATTQFVDRTHKGDRLGLPTAIDKQQSPATRSTIMVGCDPAFSPLSASAQIRASARCIAELAPLLAG